MDSHSFWQMITNRHTVQYNWIVFLKIRDSLTCFSAAHNSCMLLMDLSNKRLLGTLTLLQGQPKSFKHRILGLKLTNRMDTSMPCSLITVLAVHKTLCIFYFFFFLSAKLDSYLQERIAHRYSSSCQHQFNIKNLRHFCLLT